MNKVVHFEIHAKDQDKIQKFYEAVFGWQFKDMGPSMGNYRLITTGDNEPMKPAKSGINGGLNPRQGEPAASGAPVNAFVCTMETSDIDETLKKVMDAGGSMALDKVDVPGVGMLAYCKDPEQNIFGILQPAPMA